MPYEYNDQCYKQNVLTLPRIHYQNGNWNLDEQTDIAIWQFQTNQNHSLLADKEENMQVNEWERWRKFPNPEIQRQVLE